MNAEMIMWPGCVTCGLLAASGYAQIARMKGGWREAAAWTAPLIFTSAATALLVVLGTLALVPWLIIALVPLAVVAARSARAWREIAKLQGHRAAAAAVLGLLAARIRDALWNAREDLRDLTHRAQREPVPDAGRTAPAHAAQPAATRQVPPPAPSAPPPPISPPPPGPPPAGVLPASALSPGWTGLCAEIDGFEADTDEEVLGFFAAQLTGHMAHAGSVRDLADRLLHGTGLDPAFAQGVAEYADENADMTGAVTVLDRQFRAIYDTLRAWVDEHPAGMPHRAREFLQGEQPPLPGDDGMAA